MKYIRLLSFAFTTVASVVYAEAADGPDFTKDVGPILTKYCAGCHNDADREGKLSLQSYDALLKGEVKRSVVVY